MGAVSLLEMRAALYNSSTSINLITNTFTSTPNPATDCAYVVTASTRAAGGRTVTGVSGLGATWSFVGASGPAGVAGTPRLELWKGVNPTTGGNVTVTQDVSGEMHFTAFVLRGVDADVATLTPASVGNEQMALRYSAVLGGTVTTPSSPTPASGWTQGPDSVGSAGSARSAYRFATETPAVAHNAGYSGGTSGASLAMSFGVYAAPPPEGAGRIEWGVAIDLDYEYGVDRGVFYLAGSPGVPWNGLANVEEAPSGGETESYYYDGIKYMEAQRAEDYAATITCYSTPPEFAVCDGMRQLAAGLFATQQKRKSFGMTFRTKIGDSVQEEVGYKLHLVWNGVVAPPNRNYKTIDDQPEPNELQYALSTVPVWYGTAATYKHTAHLVIDSRYADPIALAALEDALYGTEDTIAELPTQTEVITIMEG